MSKRKSLLAALAVLLIAAMAVAGIYAVLKAQQAQAVTNTFAAVGGGNIIKQPNDDEEDPRGVKKNFKLVEDAVKLNDAKDAYVKDGTKSVVANIYENLTNGMTLHKNPRLTVNLADGAYAYIYIEVVDSLQDGLFATNYALNTAKWTKLEIKGTNNGDLYAYNLAKPVAATEPSGTTTDPVEINDESILASTTLTISDVDLDEDLGALTFYAYACQAQGAGEGTDAQKAAKAWQNAFAS